MPGAQRSEPELRASLSHVVCGATTTAWPSGLAASDTSSVAKPCSAAHAPTRGEGEGLALREADGLAVAEAVAEEVAVAEEAAETEAVADAVAESDAAALLDGTADIVADKVPAVAVADAVAVAELRAEKDAFAEAVGVCVPVVVPVTDEVGGGSWQMLLKNTYPVAQSDADTTMLSTRKVPAACVAPPPALLVIPAAVGKTAQQADGWFAAELVSAIDPLEIQPALAVVRVDEITSEAPNDVADAE